MFVSVLMGAAWLIVTPGLWSQSASAFEQFNPDWQITGTWRGNSLCVQKGTACHDEVAVYRIVTIPRKPGYLSVTGSKVVDGKEIVMGSSKGRYDSSHRTLSCELPAGTITLTLNDNKLDGTFTLSDGSILRHITLRKSE